MGARSSLSALLAATALGGPSRVSLSAITAVTMLGGPTRVSGSYLMFVQSANRAFELNRLESTSSLDKFQGFGVKTFSFTLVQAPTPEHNPYRPAVPESLTQTMGRDGYDYIKENQEIQREQHNLIQAGDTTFPYQLMIKPHDVAQYRLGAISRFYHEDYGIILARYVQFSDMASPAYIAGPCGLVQKKKGQALTWEVTNDLSKSNVNLVVGILACYTIPADGQFGWVIVDGPNLQQMGNDSTSARLGEPLSWSSSGAVGNNAAGRVIGRRVFRGNTLGLLAGYVHVELESLSEADISALIETDTKTLTDHVTQLLADVASLTQLNNASSYAQIQRSIATLQQKLALESSSRSSAVRALGNRIDLIDAVTQATLDNAITNLTNFINASQSSQDNEIEHIRDLANQALIAAQAVGPAAIASLQNQISNLLNALAAEINRVKGKFPVVDGSVPPNLMYTDDGSLVYLETF